MALLLSAAIGLEREMRQKSAGLRTYTLVGLASALIILISKYGFTDVLSGGRIVLDPSRIAAQIVSGIGFIGGGVIFVRKDLVRGLTTASTIWVTSAVGMAERRRPALARDRGHRRQFPGHLWLRRDREELPKSRWAPTSLQVSYQGRPGNPLATSWFNAPRTTPPSPASRWTATAHRTAPVRTGVQRNRGRRASRTAPSPSSETSSESRGAAKGNCDCRLGAARRSIDRQARVQIERDRRRGGGQGRRHELFVRIGGLRRDGSANCVMSAKAHRPPSRQLRKMRDVWANAQGAMRITAAGCRPQNCSRLRSPCPQIAAFGTRFSRSRATLGISYRAAGADSRRKAGGDVVALGPMKTSSITRVLPATLSSGIKG